MARLDDPDAADNAVQQFRDQIQPDEGEPQTAPPPTDQQWTRFWQFLVGVGLLAAVALFIWLIGRGEGQPLIADPAFTRGFIAVTLMLATLGVAGITTLWLLFGLKGEANFKTRVDLILKVVTPLFGIMGTVAGFYFASGDRPNVQEAAAIQARGGLVRGDTAFFEGPELGDKQLELLSRVPGVRRLIIDRSPVTDGGLAAWAPKMPDLNFLPVAASPGVTQTGINNVKEAFKKKGKTLNVSFSPDQPSAETKNQHEGSDVPKPPSKPTATKDKDKEKEKQKDELFGLAGDARFYG